MIKNQDKSKKFSDDFLWGVAYSSHQVEGKNKNNDWWAWEKKKSLEGSADACDSWNRFSEDHDLAKELGCGAFRLSLEWSRIEPIEGEFSQEALIHYKKVLQDIKKKGMKRVVTLCHWTVPIWFASAFSWKDNRSSDLFLRYSEKVLQELGEDIDFLITLNEPMVPLSHGYLTGKFPPGIRCPYSFWKARKHMISAHKKVFLASKKLHPKLPVGITQLYNFFEASNSCKFYKFLADKFANFYNHYFLDKINDYQDFVGLDYYFHDKIKFSFQKPFFKKNDNIRTTDMGWEIFPRGIYEIVKDAFDRYKKPIYIFENGLADAKDLQRSDFIKEHLFFLKKAIDEGVEVKGYFYWSLLDNFEWLHGFEPRFGLVEVDYENNFKRTPRKSFKDYQKIISENGLDF